MKKITQFTKKYLSKIVLFSIVGLIVMGGLFLASVAYGQNTTPPTITDVNRILENVRNFIYGILGAIVVIMLIWAGITFVTAEGDPNKTKKARDRVLYAVVGIAVGLLAAGAFTIVEKLMQ